MKIEITLFDIRAEMRDAWRIVCGGLPYVTVVNAQPKDLTVDYLVSPANSFGFLDGGIDLAYRNRFGVQLQARAQLRIQELIGQELPVGNALWLPTGDAGIPNIILAPTMRVPMALPTDTINPYLAAKAALSLIVNHNHLGKTSCSVAFPGMGTGVGLVPPLKCARQMRNAFEDVLRPGFPTTLQEAWDRHYQLAK